MMPIIIAGATASGKSSLALKLALKHNGEIICADSRQFYKFMRIGTASPADSEKALVAHWGFNSVDPRITKIDAGYFVNFAKEAILSCQKRGKRPILVGGTGLYLRALRYGLEDVPPSNKDIALKLEEDCRKNGVAFMYEELRRIDDQSAKLILPNDRYRILRSLEIFQITGKKPSMLRTSFSLKKPLIKAHWLLKVGDKEFYEKDLKNRVIFMVEEGLVSEALALRSLLPEKHWALDVMGYKEALLFCDGLLTKEEMIEKIYIRHRQYAKRQRTWFKREHYMWQIT